VAAIRDTNQSALIVIDVQNDVVAEAWDRDGVISRTASLVERARQEAVPVIFIQHEDEYMAADSEGWQLVPELVPAEGEPVIRKRYPDSFEETTLESTLQDLAVSRLVIAGAQTDACIRFTTQRALAEGYDLVLVGDCHTTNDLDYNGISVRAEDIIAHTNIVFQFVNYPNRTADVATYDSVSFGMPAGHQEDTQHVAS
jgi:nicotinamidase-related amidase